MKPNKSIIIAVILGLITVVALYYYLSGADNERLGLGATAERVSVVTAIVAIPEHTRITPEMVGMQEIPADAVHPETLRSLDEAVGGISRAEIMMGEQVLGGRVATDDRRASLSYRVPETMRAVSIPVDEITGVAGFISPGDKVDVLVQIPIFEAPGIEPEYVDTLTTYTVVQNALVLAAGEFTQEVDNEVRQLVSAVTLAVTPAQAEVLAFALLEGTFYLTLRSPLDEAIVDLDYFNRRNFENFRVR